VSDSVELPGVTAEVVAGAEPPMIRLAGELDLAGVDAVRRCIDGVLATGVDRLDIDLSGLEFIDSSGLSVLIATAKAVALSLHAPTPAVRRVFAVTGLDEVWDLKA